MERQMKISLLAGMAIFGSLAAHSQEAATSQKKIYKITPTSGVNTHPDSEPKRVKTDGSKVYSCDVDSKNKKVVVSRQQNNGEVITETYDLIENKK